jgi:inositol phosphorylceramide mannosyltransferase catalytic subunit
MPKEGAVVLDIPRQFHRVWLGGTMPDEFVRFGETWLELNPGWTMQQWGDDNLPALRNQALFDHLESYSAKSDVLRFELLWQFGGVYVDTDFECLRSIEPLLENVRVFASHETDWSVNGALMGAVPEHPFVDMLLATLPESVTEYGVADPVLSSGPGFITRQLESWNADGGEPVTVFPAAYFYPYLWHERHRRFEKFPDAYAIHHWAESWRGPGSPFKQKVRSALMRFWITRRIFYLNAWIRRSRR